VLTTSTTSLIEVPSITGSVATTVHSLADFDQNYIRTKKGLVVIEGVSIAIALRYSRFNLKGLVVVKILKVGSGTRTFVNLPRITRFNPKGLMVVELPERVKFIFGMFQSLKGLVVVERLILAANFNLVSILKGLSGSGTCRVALNIWLSSVSNP